MVKAAAQTARLTEAVAFDVPVQVSGPGGVTSTTWEQRHVCRAQFLYSTGSEVVEAARLEGRPIFKIRVRSCAAARSVTADWQMRDTRRAAVYAIREVDGITDPAWVYVVVEGGKAP